MSNNGHNIEKTNFDAFINAVGSEIQQAQVRLITAANAQMLFHYWKMGNYILYHQQLHGWGSKTIKQLAKAIRFNYPEKKGYSERNLTYMCQFAKAYPLRALQSFIETDAKLIAPSVEKIADEVRYLNDAQFTQEPLAQIQKIDKTISAMLQTSIDDIEKDIIDRDYRDMHRETSPLKQAEDAVLVDTSDMTIEQVIDRIVALIG